jgi:hypothetical protein
VAFPVVVPFVMVVICLSHGGEESRAQQESCENQTIHSVKPRLTDVQIAGRSIRWITDNINSTISGQMTTYR